MNLSTYSFLGHWWVLLIAVLFFVRAIFSLVDTNIKAWWHVSIWAIVCAIATMLIVMSTIEMNHSGKKTTQTTTNGSTADPSASSSTSSSNSAE